MQKDSIGHPVRGLKETLYSLAKERQKDDEAGVASSKHMPRGARQMLIPGLEYFPAMESSDWQLLSSAYVPRNCEMKVSMISQKENYSQHTHIVISTSCIQYVTLCPSPIVTHSAVSHLKRTERGNLGIHRGEQYEENERTHDLDAQRVGSMTPRDNAKLTIFISPKEKETFRESSIIQSSIPSSTGTPVYYHKQVW